MTSAYSVREENIRAMQLRIPAGLVERIDGWAKGTQIPSRNAAMRALMERSLDQIEAKKENGPVLSHRAADKNNQHPRK